jgi:hypothetical protein
MSTWRILEWSRERGRGAICGLHFDRIEFDASQAYVDDFVIGEAVHVELWMDRCPHGIGCNCGADRG